MQIDPNPKENSLVFSPMTTTDHLEKTDGLKKLNLFNFIYQLTPYQPSDIRSRSDLIQAVYINQVDKPLIFTNIKNLVTNLITRQFANPHLKAVEEILSNALDAQIRAQRQDQSIDIKIEGNTFVIQDQGDGIGYSTLVNYFVPGRSSNPEAIFKLENGIPNVRGRFGQGGLSALYFLFYQSLELSAHFPIFRKINEQEIELKFLCKLKGKDYEIIFSAKIDSLTNRIDIIQVSKNISRKDCKKSLTLHTWRQGEPAIKIKIKEKKGELKLSLIEKSKKEVGTTLKISSPLIATFHQDILTNLKTSFGFVDSPITINKEEINFLNQVQHIDFSEGQLFYRVSSLSSKGTLLICEKGRRVLELSIEGDQIPELMAINFPTLPQTQERESLDFQDPKLLKNIQNLIQAICHHLSLNQQEKMTLMNGLYPLLESTQLISEVKKQLRLLFADSICLPNHPSVRTFNVPQAVYVHPTYLDYLNLPCMDRKGTYFFYLVKTQSSIPAVPILLGNVWHILVNHSLFHENNRTITEFNFRALDKWLTLTGSENISCMEIIDSLFPILRNPTIELTDISSEDLQSYESMPEANSLLSKEEMEKFITVDNIYLMAYCNNGSKPVLKKCLIFYKDFLEKNPFKDTSYKYFLAYVCSAGVSLAKFASIATQSYQYLMSLEQKRDVEESEDFDEEEESESFNLPEQKQYLKFLNSVNLINQYLVKEDFDYKLIHQHYLKLVDFINQSGCLNQRSIDSFLSRIISGGLDQYLQLMQQLEERLKGQALEILHSLSDLSFLLSLKKDQLNGLIAILPIEELKISSQGLLQKDYELLIKFILNQPYSVVIKQQMVKVFLWIKSLENYILVKINLKLVLKVLMDHFQANNKIEDEVLKSVISTVGKITGYSCKRKKIIDSINQILKNNFNLKKDEMISFLSQELEKQAIEPVLSSLTLKESIEHLFQIEQARAFVQDGSIESYNSLISIYLDCFETNGIIPDTARPFIYAGMMSNYGQFLSKNFQFPEIPRALGFLHEDEDVLHNLIPFNSQKNSISDLAKIRIKVAIEQSSDEFFWLSELLKNAIEANAQKIEIEIHIDQENHLVVIIRDNGSGLNDEAIKALKTPDFSTKRQGMEHNPNFGKGFFSVLKNFHEVCVKTGSLHNQTKLIFFKKDEEGVLTSTVTCGEAFKGTAILLKKKNVKNPVVDLIKLKSQVVSVTKYLEKVEVFFNQQRVNSPSIQKPELEYQEPYFFQGEYVGPLIIKVGQWEEGIFFNQLKIGAFPSCYLDLLPENLKKIIDNLSIKFSISLPKAEQVMNRGRFVNQKSENLTIQLAILKASIQYCLQQWKKGELLQLLPVDYFLNYSNLNQPLNPIKKRILKAIQTNQWHEVNSNDQVTLAKEMIIKEAHRFFTSLEQTELSFCYPHFEQEPDIAQLLTKVEQISKAQNLTQIQFVLNHFKEESEFAHFLTYLSLFEKGPSLLDLRKNLESMLQKSEFLIGEEFNSLKIKQYTEKEIQDICKGFSISLKRQAPQLIKLIDAAVSSIYHHLISILSQTQQKNDEQILNNCESLKFFLVEAAKQILDFDINVVFENKSNGSIASSIREKNILTVNLKGKVKQFIEIYQTSFVSQENFIHKHSQIIIDWIETLAHEIVHMKENTSCLSTHDAAFDEKVANLLSKFFILAQNVDQKTTALELIVKGKELINVKKRKYAD